MFHSFSYTRISGFLDHRIQVHVARVRKLEKEIAVVNAIWLRYYEMLEDRRTKEETTMFEYEALIDEARQNGKSEAELRLLQGRRKAHIKRSSFTQLRAELLETIRMNMDSKRNLITVYNEDSRLNESAEMKALLPAEDQVVNCARDRDLGLMHLFGMPGVDGREDALICDLRKTDPDVGTHQQEIAVLIDILKYMTSFKRKMDMSHEKRMSLNKTEGRYKIMTKYMDPKWIDYETTGVTEEDLFCSTDDFSEEEDVETQGNASNDEFPLQLDACMHEHIDDDYGEENEEDW